jgi:hypothetical protein
VASTVYRPVATVTPGADEGVDLPGALSRTVSEWTQVYVIGQTLPRVIPWCWWFLAALVLYLLVVAVLRLFARRPDRLGLDARLQEHVAFVEPAGPESPVAISLRPTPLGKDVELQTRYLISRWGATGSGTGKLLQPLAPVVALAKVLLRRGLLPRRWAWALITPKTAGNVQYVGQGLVCVWTHPFAKSGRAWSSAVGSFDLPGDGQVKSITLELPYRMDGTARSMRVSVKIRKATFPGPSQTDEGPYDVDPELLI